MSRRKSSTALSQRDVRHAHAHREDERDHDPGDDHDHVDGEQRAEEVGDLARGRRPRRSVMRSPPRRPSPARAPRARRRARAPRARARSCRRARRPRGAARACRSSRARSSSAEPAIVSATSVEASCGGMPRRIAASTCASTSSAQYAGPTPPVAPAIAHQRLGDVDDGAEAAEQLAHLRAQLLVDRRVGHGEREHAARAPPPACSARPGRPACPGTRRAPRPASCARGSTRPPWRRRAISRGTASSCAGLCASTTMSARSASSRLEPTASPPTSAASSCARPEPESVHSTGSPQPRASARAMFPIPRSRSRNSRSATGTRGSRGSRRDQVAPVSDPGQLWLKKPFSISRARSSVESSTLRGVSRKTLSAIRCMPPSSA